jgi:hypothetical protein
MSTSAAQELAHKAAVALSEGTKQTAHAAARAAYNNTPAAWPAYDAAIKAADAAHMRAVIASSIANGLGNGPQQSLYWLTGSWT